MRPRPAQRVLNYLKYTLLFRLRAPWWANVLSKTGSNTYSHIYSIETRISTAKNKRLFRIIV